MNLPEDRITGFIREHHILTLAVAGPEGPWCATCYYAYLKERNRFVVTSEEHTRHIRDLMGSGNNLVAGAIALETRIIGLIRGIQFSAAMVRPQGDDLAQARKAYLRRFPVARLMPELHLWVLDPTIIKMTDNRLGFGKKLTWSVVNDEFQE